MTCKGCEKAVRAVLSKTEGVQSVDIDLQAQQVTVTGTASKDTLITVIRKTGKKVVGTGSTRIKRIVAELNLLKDKKKSIVFYCIFFNPFQVF